MGHPLPDAARQLVTHSLVWDNHGCLPLRPHDDSFLPQLARYRAAGVDVVSINVGFGHQSVEEHIRMLAHFRHWLAMNADLYALATSVSAIREARSQGKLAVAFDIEGMDAIGGQLSLIRLYYELGVRWMLIAYNRNNRAGGGCQDEDQGLTEFGRAAIDEMAKVGMVLCCSHTGARTARAAIDHSPNPVIFSHSNPRGVWNHERNIDDDTMRACAARGGVIGINGIGIFLGDNDNRIETIVRHIDYAVTLIGEDHVGLGLDYVFDMEEIDEYCRSMPDVFPAHIYGQGVRLVAPEQIVEVVEMLMRLGYAQSAIQKILGLNFLRVAEQVWR